MIDDYFEFSTFRSKLDDFSLRTRKYHFVLQYLKIMLRYIINSVVIVQIAEIMT